MGGDTVTDIEKMIVPINNPIYAIFGKNVGISAYTSNPHAVTTGITLTISLGLKYFAKAVNKRSIPS